MSALVVFESVTKIIYDVVKVVRPSPCGAPIWFFPLSKIAEFGVCGVCDSRVICVVSFFSPLRGMHIECDRFRRTLTINQSGLESLRSSERAETLASHHGAKLSAFAKHPARCALAWSFFYTSL